MLKACRGGGGFGRFIRDSLAERDERVEFFIL
jgi:hypothetical protein